MPKFHNFENADGEDVIIELNNNFRRVLSE